MPKRPNTQFWIELHEAVVDHVARRLLERPALHLHQVDNGLAAGALAIQGKPAGARYPGTIVVAQIIDAARIEAFADLAGDSPPPETAQEARQEARRG